MVAIAKLCYILGAKCLPLAFPDALYFECLGPVEERHIDDPDFVKWVRLLERTSSDPLGPTINSAHQMGTARMGTNAETSAVDGDGKVRGCDNLYVADRSVQVE